MAPGLLLHSTHEAPLQDSGFMGRNWEFLALLYHIFFHLITRKPEHFLMSSLVSESYLRRTQFILENGFLRPVLWIASRSALTKLISVVLGIEVRLPNWGAMYVLYGIWGGSTFEFVSYQIFLHLFPDHFLRRFML